MAVFQQQDLEGCSFTVRPNCAMSWRATKYLVLFFACCFGAVGADARVPAPEQRGKVGEKRILRK